MNPQSKESMNSSIWSISQSTNQIKWYQPVHHPIRNAGDIKPIGLWPKQPPNQTNQNAKKQTNQITQPNRSTIPESAHQPTDSSLNQPTNSVFAENVVVLDF